jgi:hypothetical protein
MSGDGPKPVVKGKVFWWIGLEAGAHEGGREVDDVRTTGKISFPSSPRIFSPVRRSGNGKWEWRPLGERFYPTDHHHHHFLPNGREIEN